MRACRYLGTQLLRVRVSYPSASDGTATHAPADRFVYVFLPSVNERESGIGDDGVSLHSDTEIPSNCTIYMA